MRVSLLTLGLLVSACGGRAPGARPCPADKGPNCWLFTPGDTGLTRGQGANVEHIATRPEMPTRGQLLVFLNGSGGSPLAGTSLYAVARDEGLHVLGLSYRSGDAVGVLCKGDDACFEPTRLTLLLGEPQAGAASALANAVVDEGVEPRLLAALKLLETLDAEGGWSQFLEGEAVAWSRVIASGHSQGGGHAALLAKRHTLARTLMLASPCDALTDGQPATWLSDSTGWKTAPSAMFGLWASGDTTCPAAPTAWERLGLPAAARDADAGCAGQAAHGAPLTCSSNEARWRTFLREP